MIAVTRIALAGVDAHHSTTAAATTANTPLRDGGLAQVGRAHAPDGRRRPRGYSRVDARMHFPTDVLLGALVATSAAHITVHALERRVTR